MATIPAQTQPEITIIDGHAVTTSIAIAEYFSKRHDDVLKKIRALDCSPEFHARNFAEMSIDVTVGNGAVRQTPAYQITRDGFAFLAMGFTGKRAAIFKEAYIEAFNRMEEALLLQIPRNCRILYTYDARGVVTLAQVAREDEFLTSAKDFAEVAHRQGYMLVKIDSDVKFGGLV